MTRKSRFLNLRPACKSLLIACSLLVIFVAATASPAAAQAAKHPLDALTQQEHWTVFEALKASGHTDAKTIYALVSLHEPPKEEVLKWKPGEPFRREALVVVKQGPKTFEAVVDVAGAKLASWKEVPGVQPNLTEEEIRSVDEGVKANPEWQAAMRRRGIAGYETVECYGLSPGYFGTPEEQGRRLQYVLCGDRRGTSNLDARPIEGLTVVWDSNERKVLRVIDTGAVPVPTAPADYDAGSVGPLREIPTPIRVDQPLGPSFRLDGQEVNWQKWNFHFRMDPRVGLVVSNVRYADGDRLRSILYEGSLSEIFVPYMDPSEGWSHLTYFDAGEYAGELFFSLEPGSDCPQNSVYFDMFHADEHGIPQRTPRAACLFEQYAGDLAWRHRGETGIVESRKSRDLVLRTIMTSGNYDYLFDWVFRQDGTIKVRVGATGIDAVKAVTAKTVADDPDGDAETYGRYIAENTVAVDHDHFFCFRLDFDVDGTANSFVRDQLKTQRLPAGNPRKSLWVAVPQVAHVEQEAKLHTSMDHPEIWRVINPNVKSRLGHPVGYEIIPGHDAMPLLHPDDYPQRRAGFTEYEVWVTPFHQEEQYAAGDYPTQSKGGDGLPSWTHANRPIENTDIVVWYTLGFHHVPRAEDWPVMHTVWHEFELSPYNFFDRNPALDLPK